MVYENRTIYSYGLNKGFGSKFCICSQVWHETPEKCQRAHQLKCCEYKNKEDDKNPNSLSDKKNDLSCLERTMIEFFSRQNCKPWKKFATNKYFLVKLINYIETNWT